MNEKHHSNNKILRNLSDKYNFYIRKCENYPAMEKYPKSFNEIAEEGNKSLSRNTH